MSKRLVFWISAAALLLSVLWFIAHPSYEPAVAFLFGLAGLIGSNFLNEYTPPMPQPESPPLIDDARVDKVVDAFCSITTRDPGGVPSFVHAGAALMRNNAEVVEAVERIKMRGFQMSPLPYVATEIPQEEWLDFLKWHARKHPELKYYFNPQMFAHLKEMYLKDRDSQPTR